MSPIPTKIPYGKNSVMQDELLDEYEMSGEKRVTNLSKGFYFP
jgi:hypothetical protein